MSILQMVPWVGFPFENGFVLGQEYSYALALAVLVIGVARYRGGTQNVTDASVRFLQKRV